MGFLDSKERIFDTVVTEHGRSKLAREGSLGIQYVAFTDEQAVYNDITSSLYFHIEAPSFRHKDITTFIPKEGAGSINSTNIEYAVVDGKVLDSSGNFITGSDFRTTASLLFSSSLDNFENSQLINSYDTVSDKNTFKLSNTSFEFKLTDDSPIRRFKLRKANVNDLESMFQDKKLGKKINYQYLPPVVTDATGGVLPMGNYANLGQEVVTHENLMATLTEKPQQTVYMNERSAENNIVGQMFEIRNDKIRVLDVVDFGVWNTSAAGAQSHIFFVGKIYNDDFGSSTFVNLFTLVFE